MSKFNLYEADWNGNDITDNAGAGTIEEAIDSGIRMCEDSRHAFVQICDEDDDSDVKATVIAPSHDENELTHDQSIRDDLRMALFGQNNADADAFEWEEWVKGAMDIIVEANGFNACNCDCAYYMSNVPIVVKGDDLVKVYTSQAVKDALYTVFMEEVEKFKAEQEAE